VVPAGHGASGQERPIPLTPQVILQERGADNINNDQ